MTAYLRKTKDRTPRPAAFLDRDGTIVHDRPGFYLTDPAALRIYGTAPAALRAISALGYRLIIITNQAGIGRGYMTLARSKAVNRELRRRLERAGVKLDAIYFCPHHPDAGCGCRKPRGGMIEEAVKNHPIDLSRSVVIGDKTCDMKLAELFRLRSVLVRTGHGRSELAEHPGLARGRAVKKDLAAAAAWLRGKA